MNPCIEIFRGDYKPITVTFTANGVAMDISGYTLFFTAKLNIGDADADAVISKVVTEHTDPVHGISLLELTPEDTDQAIRDYWFDIQLVSGEGSPMTAVRGTLKILQDITQRVS
jgi:hypothetical protein